MEGGGEAMSEKKVFDHVFLKARSKKVLLWLVLLENVVLRCALLLLFDIAKKFLRR